MGGRAIRVPTDFRYEAKLSSIVSEEALDVLKAHYKGCTLYIPTIKRGDSFGAKKEAIAQLNHLPTAEVARLVGCSDRLVRSYRRQWRENSENER